VTLSRRHLIAGFGTVALTGSGLIGGLRPAAAQDVNVAELHKPGPLGDKILGSESAPVTIVEYASVTCGACAAFHQQTYPTLKSKYIDTGKVRLIMREFPTAPAPVAIGGFMLARCGNDRYFPLWTLSSSSSGTGRRIPITASCASPARPASRRKASTPA
jgi:protein-disulfide isomerase